MTTKNETKTKHTQLETELLAALKELKAILEKPASNRVFMQIAEPARRCLNIINQSISKAEKGNEV